MGGIQKPCNQISFIETACVLDLFVFSIIKVCCKAQMKIFKYSVMIRN